MDDDTTDPTTKAFGGFSDRELEMACAIAGVSITKVGRVWTIGNIAGCPQRPGRGLYDTPEQAIVAGMLQGNTERLEALGVPASEATR